jgi:hypothetical protein
MFMLSSVARLAFFLTFRRNANPGRFCKPAPVFSRRANSGRLRASALAEQRAVKDVYKWMGIVFAIGVALMVIEYRFAKKKKEGYTRIDRQRILGIFWLTIFFSLLVGGIVWFSD